MAKIKVRDLKKYITSLEAPELREEIVRLFTKLPQVQDFYAQELFTEEERKVWLNEYKDKIRQCFCNRTGSIRRKIKRSELRDLLVHFERVSVSAYDLTDLYLYRVETFTWWAISMRSVNKSEFQSALSFFEKTLTLMQQQHLFPYFEERCQTLFKPHQTDGWYLYALQRLYREYKGE